MGCSHNWKPSFTHGDFICTKCGITSQKAGHPKRRRGKYKGSRMHGAPGRRGGGSRAPWIALGLIITLIAGATWWAATEGINMATDAVDDATGIITEAIDEVAPDVEQAVGTVVGTVSDAVEG